MEIYAKMIRIHVTKTTPSNRGGCVVTANCSVFFLPNSMGNILFS